LSENRQQLSATWAGDAAEHPAEQQSGEVDATLTQAAAVPATCSRITKPAIKHATARMERR